MLFRAIQVWSAKVSTLSLGIPSAFPDFGIPIHVVQSVTLKRAIMFGISLVYHRLT